MALSSHSWSFDLPTVCPATTEKLREYSQLASRSKRRRLDLFTVLFLTSKVTKSQRSTVLAQLCDPESAETWPERPQGVNARSVQAAKWIRNWTPGKDNAPSIENCIARMVRTSLCVTSNPILSANHRIVPGGEAFGKRKGCGMIFVDEDTLSGLDTEKGAEVIVATWVWVPRDEANDPGTNSTDADETEVQLFTARVPIRRANLLLGFAYDSETNQAFEEIVPNLTKLEFNDAGNAMLDKSNDEDNDGNSLPSHLSAALRVTVDKIAIVSLAYLTDSQTENLIARIRQTSKELKADDTAGSDNDGEQVADTKEETETSEGEESADEDAQTLPIKIYNWPAGIEPCSRAGLYKIFQNIQPSFRPGRKTKYALFVDIPDPSGESQSEPVLLLVKQSYPYGKRAELSYDNVIEILKWPDDESVVDLWQFVADPMSDSDRANREERPWFERILPHYFELVSRPDRLIWPKDEVQCFILIDLSETELRKLKSKILEKVDAESWTPLEFIEAGASLKSADIQGLMQWFEECMVDGVQPPHEFVAVDQQSFDYYVKNEGDKDEAMIIASSESMHNRHNDAKVNDFIGLGFGRLSTEDATNGCVGLGVANQSFVNETVEREKITYLYWSDILEAARLDPGEGMEVHDPDYGGSDDDDDDEEGTKVDEVFSAQPPDSVE